jgi:hypothetical protein
MFPAPVASPTTEFGKTPAQVIRATVILGILGTAAVAGLVRLLTRPHSPFGSMFAETGAPTAALYAVAIAPVWLLAAYGCWRSLRDTQRFRLGEEGLEVTGPLGGYVVPWSAMSEAAVTPGGALGLKLSERDTLVASHRGTPQQREWLRTMERFGEWDLLYPQSELGRPAAEVLVWVRDRSGL